MAVNLNCRWNRQDWIPARQADPAGLEASAAGRRSHLLQCGVARASDNLSSSVDINEPPGAIRRIGGILVSLPQEVKIRQAFFEVVQILRVTPGLVVVQADGADVLIASPDRLLFHLAASDRCPTLKYRQAGQRHDYDQPQGHQKSVAGLSIAATRLAAPCAACSVTLRNLTLPQSAPKRVENSLHSHWFDWLDPASPPPPPPTLAGATIGTVAWRPEVVSSTSAESLPILSSR
jgi:hypothetical protein